MENQNKYSMKKRISVVLALLFFSFLFLNSVSAANLIVFNSSAPSQTPYFVVNGTTGSVGIGTASPGVVNGYSKFELVGTAANALGPHIKLTTSTDAYPVFQALGWAHDNVGLDFDSYYDGTWRSADAGSNFQIYKLNDVLRFRYDSGIAAGSAVTWEEGISLTPAGRVGIGTGTPSNSLDVRGVGNFSGTVYFNNRTDLSANLTSLWIEALNKTNTSYVPYTGATSNVNLGVYNLTTTTGMVGIGTTAPVTELDVAGEIRAFTSSSSNGIIIGNHSGITSGVTGEEGVQLVYNTVSKEAVFTNVRWGTSYNNITFNALNFNVKTGSGSTSQAFVVNSAGNVGIGTTAPLAKLDVRGGSVFVRSNPAGAHYLNITGIDGSGTFITDNYGWIRFKTGSGAAYDSLYLGATGNVGIGTTTPYSLLHTSSTANNTLVITADSAGTHADDGGTNPRLTFNTETTENTSIIARNLGGYHRLDFNVDGGSGEVNTLTLNGQNNFVGIGTTAPSAALDVRGFGNFSGTVYINNRTDLSANLTSIISNAQANATYLMGLSAGSGTPIFYNVSGMIMNNLTYGSSFNISNNFFANATHVGIGAGRLTAPLAALDVNGSFAVVSTLSGGGNYTIGVNSVILGTTGSGANISSFGTGSLAGGYALGNITAGAFASIAHGVSLSGSSIIASNRADFAQGYATGAGSQITSSGAYGSFAQGYALAAGIINSSGTATFVQGYANTGKIHSNGYGAFAQGYSAGGYTTATNYASLAQGMSYYGNITSSGYASLAQGYANYGNINASGNGAVAIGSANYGNIYSLGEGSFAWGNNTRTSGNYSFVLGTALNYDISKSFIVGFDNSVPSIFANGTTVGIGNVRPPTTLFVNGSFAAIVGTGFRNIDSSSFALAYAGSAAGNITSIGAGSLAIGRNFANGNITASGSGSIAGGYSQAGNLVSSASGSIALGYVGTGGLLSASSTGSFAQGYATSGTISAAAAGAFAQGNGNIYSLASGSFAQGLGSGAGGIINSSASGSFAQGFAQSGNITSTGIGSWAIGAAYFGNINSTGTGSFAWGNNTHTSGNYSFVVGPGLSNALSNVFMVGFGSSTPTLFVNGSAIGIGTTSPNSKLEVIGTLNVTGGAAGVKGLYVDSVGRAGIGMAPTYQLDVTGGIRASTNVTAAAFYYSSDARLKKNIVELNNSDALAKIMQIKPVEFDWINPASGTGKKIGLIAQNVETVFPELIGGSTAPDNVTYKSVEYGNLVSPIISSIQEQQSQIEQLRIENKKQMNELNLLRKEIESLKNKSE